MKLPSLTEMDQAAQLVYAHMSASTQLEWPLLSERCGCRVIVKHENHNPTGAFKVRGGLLYLSRLLEREPDVSGLVTATRGNHGQSIALAAQRLGLRPVIVVPQGNSEDKNRAMAALGGELVVHGADFDAAAARAREIAIEQGLHAIPSFHPDLVLGVGSYALELLREHPDIAKVYVPVGLGSGICGVICAREALGLETEIVGVVAAGADAYARSFAAGRVVSTDSADTFADGVAVRIPNKEALALMDDHAAAIVAVQEDEIEAAVRHLFSDTHNVAEGAGAAPLAALLRDREENAGRKVAIILSGGNIDRAHYARIIGQ